MASEVSLQELREQSIRLAKKRARIVAIILDELGERDTLARKPLEELLRLALLAREEARKTYRWRSRNEIVLCTEEAC